MVFWWIYVDRCLGARVIVGVLWFCDVPISYAKVIDNRYGGVCMCAQVCCTALLFE